MIIAPDLNAAATTVRISDLEVLQASGGNIKVASDLVAVIVHLIQKHGDLPVWDAHHEEIDSVWLHKKADSDDRCPDLCIMLG